MSDEEVLSVTDIMNGAEDTTGEPVEETPQADPVETEAKAETPEAEETTTDEPPSSDKPEDRGLMSAMLDEREKRQERDRRIAELEAQLNQKAEAPKTPDPVEDPEGFQQSLEQQRQVDRFELSRMTMEAVKDDYAEKEQLFLAEAQKSPYLQNLLREAANPALLAYQEGERIAARAQVPEVNTVLEQKVAELQAEIDTLKGAPKAPNLAKTGQAGIETQPEESQVSVTQLLNQMRDKN